VSPFSISRLIWEQRYERRDGGTSEAWQKGIKVAVVMRSRRVTRRGVMLSGMDRARGVGYGGAPDVRYMVVASGSSSMAGIASYGLLFPNWDSKA